MQFFCIGRFKIKYVAAKEMMNSAMLTRFFRLTGAHTVKMNMELGEKEIRRRLDPSDTKKNI